MRTELLQADDHQISLELGLQPCPELWVVWEAVVHVVASDQDADRLVDGVFVDAAL